MGVTFKTNINKFPEMVANLQNVDGKKVNVGVIGEQAWLAGIHEYGCKIPVTPKMRAWLHGHDIHLKPTTTQIVIPERSFLRKGFDENVEKVMKKIQRFADLIIHGKISDEEFLGSVGELLRDAIKKYALDLKEPAKSAATLKLHPNATNPLVQTGDMIEHIGFEVE